MVQSFMPKTFYFGQYSQLQGRYDLAQVTPALNAPVVDESLQAAADFLRLARINQHNVENWDFEASNAELESISSLLTQRVRANWKQNPHLKLVVKIESLQNNQRFLQFRVEDTRHDFTSRLDRRSTGFQWFISFIASFFEFEKNANIILLLDEPGLSLHARAQMDLLDAIDKHLTKGRQVIYTTHSPFMVRTERLDQVRIVEDQGPGKGAVVFNDAGITKDPDTLFPLQAALGYDVAQNLFIGHENIILEGVSDMIYLTSISAHLEGENRNSLRPTARLLPAGGATDIATFIALLGAQLEVVVLLDGNAQRQRIDNAIAQGRLTAQRVLSMDQFCNIKGADIEDLFAPEEYLNLYNATFKTNISADKLQGNDRIIKRLERHEGKEFNHGRVAQTFLNYQKEIIPTLSAATINRFEALIAALNGAVKTTATATAY
jgi:predicted ATP-dependent endonuclease of OLD family